MSLRKIKPISLAGLTPAKVDGELPRVLYVAPTDLSVDATYQRDLSENSIRLIRRLIENFAWNRFKPPIVVQASAGALHVVDGQHTAIVAASLAIPKIPVFIVEAATIDERARAFVGHNSDRIMVSPFDIYRALLAAGDPDAVDVDNVCKRAGVRIRQLSPSSAIAEGDTAAVGVVRQLVKRRGVIKARQVLQCLVKAHRAPLVRSEILAIDYLLCGPGGAPDLDAVTAAIRIEGNDGLGKAFARARTERIPVWKALADRYAARCGRAAPRGGKGAAA